MEESIAKNLDLRSIKEKIIQKILKLIKEVVTDDKNLVILKLIENNVPSDVIKKIYPKKIDKLINYGLIDGNAVVKFSEETKLSKAFNYKLKAENKLSRLIDIKKVKLFSALSKEEKLVLFILNINETISSKNIGKYSDVSDGTRKKYDTYFNDIHINLKGKFIISSLILNKEIYQIEQIFHGLKTKGMIWEEKTPVYSVVYKKIIKILPNVSENYIENFLPNIKNEILNTVEFFIKNNKEEGLFFLDLIINSNKTSNSFFVPREITRYLKEIIGDKFPFDLKYIYTFYRDDIYILPLYSNIISKKLIQTKLGLIKGFWERLSYSILENFKHNNKVNVSCNVNLERKWININSIESTVKVLILPYITFNDLDLIRDLLERCNHLLIILTHQKYPAYKKCLEQGLNQEDTNKIYSIFLKKKEFEVYPKKQLPLNLNKILQIENEIYFKTIQDKNLFESEVYCMFCGEKISSSNLKCPYCGSKLD